MIRVELEDLRFVDIRLEVVACQRLRMELVEGDEGLPQRKRSASASCATGRNKLGALARLGGHWAADHDMADE